jgi:hypothetical protein
MTTERRRETPGEAGERAARADARRELCSCGHPFHTGQCSAPDGCWCDDFASRRCELCDALISNHAVKPYCRACGERIHFADESTVMCDHCGVTPAELRHPRDGGAFCLECLRNHGEDESEYERL